jgi:hypothetical protein
LVFYSFSCFVCKKIKNIKISTLFFKKTHVDSEILSETRFRELLPHSENRIKKAGSNAKSFQEFKKIVLE